MKSETDSFRPNLTWGVMSAKIWDVSCRLRRDPMWCTLYPAKHLRVKHPARALLFLFSSGKRKRRATIPKWAENFLWADLRKGDMGATKSLNHHFTSNVNGAPRDFWFLVLKIHICSAQEIPAKQDAPQRSLSTATHKFKLRKSSRSIPFVTF